MRTYNHSRIHRLLAPAEFRRVFQQARSSRDRFFTILWRANEQQRPRLGFALAKKKIPLAVGRNRVRRLTRESFRQNRQELPGVDIVVLAQAAAGTAGNSLIFASLEKHWKKISRTGLGTGKISANR